MSLTLLSVVEAARRVRTDHTLLLDRVAGRTEHELRRPYRVGAGPLGDFCESRHDLVAHVLMWDEINLAVLHEALAGRGHWSIDPRWETPEIGRALNKAGVVSGRELPAGLLVDRLVAVRDALLGRLESLPAEAWSASNTGIGALVQRAMTVPGAPPYWHAALHLRQVPAGESPE